MRRKALIYKLKSEIESLEKERQERREMTQKERKREQDSLDNERKEEAAMAALAHQAVVQALRDELRTLRREGEEMEKEREKNERESRAREQESMRIRDATEVEMIKVRTQNKTFMAEREEREEEWYVL